MNKSDIEFLKELQHEMLTQDTVCQADPRFWVIVQKVKDYWVEDNIDGICIYSSDDCESLFEGDFDEVHNFLNTIDGIKDCKFDEFQIEFIYNDKKYEIYYIDELHDFFKESDLEYTICNYRERDEIVKNTMFLTKRECQEHIEANRHHYDSTSHPYAMTAWRSPQVERLYKILQNTNWDEFIK